MRRLILAVALLIGFAPIVASATAVAPSGTVLQVASTQSLQTFNSPAAAQKHCPGDVVVWLNTRSGIYHYAGQRWYGRTE